MLLRVVLTGGQSLEVTRLWNNISGYTNEHTHMDHIYLSNSCGVPFYHQVYSLQRKHPKVFLFHSLPFFVILVHTLHTKWSSNGEWSGLLTLPCSTNAFVPKCGLASLHHLPLGLFEIVMLWRVSSLPKVRQVLGWLAEIGLKYGHLYV